MSKPEKNPALDRVMEMEQEFEDAEDQQEYIYNLIDDALEIEPYFTIGYQGEPECIGGKLTFCIGGPTEYIKIWYDKINYYHLWGRDHYEVPIYIDELYEELMQRFEEMWKQ